MDIKYYTVTTHTENTGEKIQIEMLVKPASKLEADGETLIVPEWNVFRIIAGDRIICDLTGVGASNFVVALANEIEKSGIGAMPF